MMSCFVYLDSQSTPTGIQRFETMPSMVITVPSNALYIEDASTLAPDTLVFTNWRIKSGVLTDVGPNPGTSYRWDVSQEVWVPDIEKAKSNKLQELKDTRIQKEAGGFVWDSSTFDSDPISQIRMQSGTSLALMAINSQQTFTIDWTLKDNTTRTLSAAEMIQVNVALANHITTVHDIYKTLKNQVDTATTVQVVDSITWP